MSGVGFRILLNISNFFSDHRHRARLFINDETKTIGCLQKKISSMFGITDFYLVCDDSYLHPSENIQVLQKHDLVWAIPDAPNQMLEGSRRFSARHLSSLNDIQNIEHRKRKTNQNGSNICDSRLEKKSHKSSYHESDSESIKKLKTKRKKYADICELDDSIVFKSQPKLKKKKRDKDDEAKQSQIKIKSLYVSKGKGDRSPCEVDLSSHVKPTTDEYLKEKRINVVRIDYINPQIQSESTEKRSLLEDTSPVNFAPDFTSPPETINVQNPSPVGQNKAQEVERKEKKQRFFKTPEYVRQPRSNVDTVTSSTSNESGNSNCIHDKRRQGNLFETPPYVREHITGDGVDVNRKLQNGCLSQVNNIDSNKSTGELQIPEDKETYMSDIVVSSIFNKSTINADSTRSSIPALSDLHRKQTDDTEDVNAFDSNVTKHRRRARRRSKKKKEEDTSNVIVISESPSQPKPLITKACPSIHIVFNDEGEEAKPIEDEKALPLDNANMTVEKAIEAAVPLTNTTPRVGDTIAFKVLKMSDDYSPTVSAYIVGKVVDFVYQHGEVVFDIIRGLEELKEPKGKLSLEDVGDNESKQRTFSWNNLIQPKLLA